MEKRISGHFQISLNKKCLSRKVRSTRPLTSFLTAHVCISDFFLIPLIHFLYRSPHSFSSSLYSLSSLALLTRLPQSYSSLAHYLSSLALLSLSRSLHSPSSVPIFTHSLSSFARLTCSPHSPSSVPLFTHSLSSLALLSRSPHSPSSVEKRRGEG